MTATNSVLLSHPAAQTLPKDDSQWQSFIRSMVEFSSSPAVIDSALAEYALLLPTPVDSTLRPDIASTQSDVTTLQTNVTTLQSDVNALEIATLMGIYG